MTINHIGALTLTDAGAADSIAAGLREMLGVIEGLLTVRTATDLGLREGNASLLFILEFDSREAWEAYGDHPAHKALIAERIAPALAAKAFLQAASIEETRAP